MSLVIFRQQFKQQTCLICAHRHYDTATWQQIIVVYNTHRSHVSLSSAGDITTGQKCFRPVGVFSVRHNGKFVPECWWCVRRKVLGFSIRSLSHKSRQSKVGCWLWGDFLGCHQVMHDMSASGGSDETLKPGLTPPPPPTPPTTSFQMTCMLPAGVNKA